MLKSCVLALACVLSPVTALAAPSSQVKALWQQIAALKLDQALNLSQQQAQALLPEIQAAQAQVQAFKNQLVTSEPARVAALTQAVADLKATGTVAASTVQALQTARGSSFASLRQNLKSCWQQARQILTASQSEALRTLTLGISPPPSNAVAGSNGP